MILTKGQGAIEYLLIIGAAVIIAVIVISLMMGLGGQGTGAVEDADTRGTYQSLYEKQASAQGNEYVAAGDEEKFVYIGPDKSVTDFMGTEISEGTKLKVNDDSGELIYTYTSGSWNPSSGSVSTGSLVTVVAGNDKLLIPNEDNLEETTFCTWEGEGIHSFGEDKVYCGEGTLMWTPALNGPIGLANEREVLYSDITLSDIKELCEQLSYAGFDDWKLPTCKSQKLDDGCQAYAFGKDYCDFENCGRIYDYSLGGYVDASIPTCSSSCYTDITTNLDTLGTTGAPTLNLFDHPNSGFTYIVGGGLYLNWSLLYPNNLLPFTTTRCVRES